MSENATHQDIPPDRKQMISKGGPIAGSAISIIGASLVLLGFVLPWASCGGYRLSGLDIVTQSAQGNTGDSSGTLLCLVPFFAVGMLGIAIVLIPAILWKKIPAIGRPIGTALLCLFAALACCPSCLFFANMQSSRNDPYSYGMGGYIHVEYGFWVTMFGIFISFFGGLLGVGSSIAAVVISKRKPLE